MDYFIVIYRTLLFYIIITVIYRFMGKREVGQLGIVDLIVSMLIAELAAISIDNRSESVFLSIVPIAILVLIEIGLAFLSLKYPKIRSIFDGNPSVIINGGIINFKEMIRQRYNLNDLLTQLRENGISSIEDVSYAVLETSGKLSVFKKDEDNITYPLPVIIDGIINYSTLKQIKRNRKWVMDTLKKDQVDLNDVFYAFYRNKRLYIIKNNNMCN